MSTTIGRFVPLVTIVLACCSPACSTHKVNSWERWCEQIAGVDLEDKYNQWGAVFSVSFDAVGIRSDFVERFNAMVVSEGAKKYLGGAKANDPVVQELVRLRLLGVWREGADLHWANTLLDDDPMLGGDQFQNLVHSIQGGLAGLRRSQNASEADRCLWGTVDGVFDHLVLHGPKDGAVTIDLRNTLKGK